MLRRWSLGIGLSLVIHALVVGGAVGVALWRGNPFGRVVDVEITGMSLEEIKDLPLGAPPGGPLARKAESAARPPPRAPRPPDGAGELAPREEGKRRRARGDAPEAPDAPEPAPRPTDLRQYGPAGSRVTALIRLDRLRATPYGPAVDEILMHLPDRRDLIDGTGLDLYKDFDAILIATPNPLDYKVTFLAARHHLSDPQLKAALDRGAKATGRVLTWRTEGRRPVAERRARDPSSPSAPARDERMIVLPAPGLAVVTPPVYRSMLLRPARSRSAASAATPDGGADAGAGARGSDALAGPAPPEGDAWRALLRRIDAEDSILPPNAVAMLNAVDIFSARGLRSGLGALAGGATTGGAAGAPDLDLPLPKVLTLVLGAEPTPFADLGAEFASEADARRWEQAWPTLRNRMARSPYLVLTGFVSLLARAELEREGAVVRLHQTATEAETIRLLQLIGRFALP